MNNDIFAKSRNGHMLVDTFDRTTSTLDIRSNGLYPSNVLSNLAHNPFEIDGVQCSSLEGFLQSLKTPDIDEQQRICSLYGGSAKNESKNNNRWKDTQKLYWQGIEYNRDSEEYKKLLFRAFSECYSQNKIYRTALDNTKGITLTHKNGNKDISATVLTADEFINILTKIRDEKD